MHLFALFKQKVNFSFISTFLSIARIQFAFATVIKTNRSSKEDIDAVLTQTDTVTHRPLPTGEYSISQQTQDVCVINFEHSKYLPYQKNLNYFLIKIDYLYSIIYSWIVIFNEFEKL